jgi:hypothetical protein
MILLNNSTRKISIKILVFSFVGLIVPLNGIIFDGVAMKDPKTGKVVIVLANSSDFNDENQTKRIQDIFVTLDLLSEPGKVQLLLEAFPNEIDSTFKKVGKIKSILNSNLKKREGVELYPGMDEREAFLQKGVLAKLAEVKLENICVRKVDPRGEFKLCMDCLRMEKDYMLLRKKVNLKPDCEFADKIEKAQENTRKFLEYKKSPLFELIPKEGEKLERWESNMAHKGIELASNHAIEFIESIREKFKENWNNKQQSIFNDSIDTVKQKRVNTIEGKMCNNLNELSDMLPMIFSNYCTCLSPMLEIQFLDCFYDKEAPQKTIVVTNYLTFCSLEADLLKLGWQKVYSAKFSFCPKSNNIMINNFCFLIKNF